MPTSISRAVANASEQLVIQASAARIGVLHVTWPFLPPTSNVIDQKALAFIEPLYGQHSLATSQTDELADYLALSCCCHALDGWRYLAQSALALLNGARNQSVHLAYYAELRAALSLLASSGIGILNRKHFAITSLRQVEWFKKTTHDAAWEALAEWAKMLPNALRVMDCFEASGMKASKWAEACNAAPSIDAISAHWLNNWGIDLKLMSEDKTLRNEASYRPNLCQDALDRVSKADVEFINDVNNACGSISGGRFESIDLMVINDLCHKACELRCHNIDIQNMNMIWSDISTWISVHESTLDGVREVDTVRNATTTPAGRIMFLADPTNRSAHGVISRALLLLRLAEALKRRTWKQMRLMNGTNEWPEKMAGAYGLCANLWDGSARLTDYSVLDADRIEAQEELEAWLATQGQFNACKMWRDIPQAVIDLCRFERVGVIAAAS